MNWTAMSRYHWESNDNRWSVARIIIGQRESYELWDRKYQPSKFVGAYPTKDEAMAAAK